MRILHVSSGNLYGGVERLLTVLAAKRELCPSMEAEFALCFEGRLADELRLTGAPVHFAGPVRTSRPISLVRARRFLRNLIETRHVDAVVCHSAWPLAIFGPAVRAARAPLILWLHDAVTGRHWLERWARLTPPDLLLGNSVYTMRTAQRFFPKVRAQLIYYPVDSFAPKLDEAERFEVRNELNTPIDATVIIQVSRMESWKGHQLHLEALGKIADQPGWICWIVGGPQRPFEERYFDGLKALARRLRIEGRVRFVGARSDVPRLLSAADVFCQPNTGPEPFGIVFVEALFSKLPVVSTAMGGACEIVDDSCGILVAPNDPGALSETLLKLIRDGASRARLGAAAPVRAEALCDVKRQIGRLAAALGDADRRGNYYTSARA
jgi:glycosyltransferase involved in cell wall biosynthesis